MWIVLSINNLRYQCWLISVLIWSIELSINYVSLKSDNITYVEMSYVLAGLFRSLDNSNPARNNHSTPVWSLIQTYLFYELILSLVGFQCINYVLSNLLCLPPLGLGSSHFSLWNHQVSTLIDCLVQCHLFFSYSRLTKIVTSFTGCLNANLYTSFCSGS